MSTFLKTRIYIYLFIYLFIYLYIFLGECIPNGASVSLHWMARCRISGLGIRINWSNWSGTKVATEVRKHYHHRALQVWTRCYCCSCASLNLSAHVKESGFRNPTIFCSWNPESSCGSPESEIQCPDTGILGVKSKFQDCLGFPCMGRKLFRLTLRWFIYPLSGLPLSLWHCANVVWNDFSEIVFIY